MAKSVSSPKKDSAQLTNKSIIEEAVTYKSVQPKSVPPPPPP